MKIMIVRHGKVNMKWPKMCSSEDFDKACHFETVLEICTNTDKNNIKVSNTKASDHLRIRAVSDLNIRYLINHICDFVLADIDRHHIISEL